MCGIAGAIDLTGQRWFPRERLLAMTGVLAHRGPDEEQLHVEPGVALGVRRLAIIDVAGGSQPLSNEDGTVWVAYEGELFEYPDLRRDLLGRGHVLKTNCDTEAWVHLYEDFGEEVFQHTRGQYGVSLWDRDARTLLLGRDRAGIAPMFYTEADGWLLWASEIKALLASGLVDARPDPRGLDFFFNFFSVSSWRTCFDGIRQLQPGHYLKIRDGHKQIRRYRDLEFPDRGSERHDLSQADATEQLEELLRGAIRRRLVGEANLCCYLSGGLDSTTVLGLGTQENGGPLPSFTISLDGSGPSDEEPQSSESARYLGSQLTTLRMTSRDICDAFPELIRGAEAPVLDSSAACMVRLAQAVRQAGYKVSLTGEGSDEALAGYVWFKGDKAAQLLTRPGYRIVRRFLFGTLVGGGAKRFPPFAATGGVRTAQQFTYEIMAQSRNWLYSDHMWNELDGYSPYDELGIDTEPMRRLHPLNQSLYMANRVMLPGMLLAAKGDRPMRNASTEGRFPFLDERVVDFCASLPPSYKLRGLTDKWLLRQVARKTLPRPIANRPKTMFRANMSWLFVRDDRPTWVDDLLSEASIRNTGYFDYEGVQRVRRLQASLPRKSFRRFSLDMGLMGVISTQLWHHIYLGGELADLPSWHRPEFARRPLPSAVPGPVES